MAVTSGTPGKGGERGQRDALLQAIAYASERFLRGEVLEDAVQDGLAALGRATSVDRAYVFENSRGPGGELRVNQRFEWVAPGIVPQLDNPELQDASYGELGVARWIEVMRAGEPIHGPVQELPLPERAILEIQDIKSLLVVPIFLRGDWWGFAGFDDCRTPRRWSEGEIDLLRAAGHMLGAALSHRRDQAALHEARERLGFLVSAGPAVMYSCGAEPPYPVTFCSDNVTRHLGYEPEAFTSTPTFWRDHVHPDDLARVYVEPDEAYQGDTRTIEYRFLHRGGSYRWMRDFSRLLRDGRGRPTEIVGYWYDITEQRAVEAALHRSESRFAVAFHASPAAMIIRREQGGVILAANPAFLALSGFERDEVVGAPVTRFVVPSEERAELEQGEALLRTADGGVKTVLGARSEIDWDEAPCYLETFSDISERKQTEEQLMQAFQEVMQDAAWFSRSVMEKLAQMRSPKADRHEVAELTGRERQVLEMIAAGKSNRAIAEGLGLADTTVRNYIVRIYGKLGVSSRAEAIVWARERGMAGLL